MPDSPQPIPREPAVRNPAAITSQNWFLLAQFNYYRLIIGIAATILALAPLTSRPFGEDSPRAFAIAAIVYLLISMTANLTIRNQDPAFDQQTIALGLADILIITVMMHASGGLSSGIGLMLLVAIAESSVLLQRKPALALAGAATLAVFAEHLWPLVFQADADQLHILREAPKAAMMGAGIFVTATFINSLATRLRSTAAWAELQGISLSNASRINDLIIQHMQSGVVVCDNHGRIRTINEAAQNFLGLNANGSLDQSLETEAPELAKQLTEWIAHPVKRTRKLLRTTTGFTLMPRFIFMGSERNYSGIVIFLEDTEVLRQQAQQLKMAALARLAASIAHEVRNPLSAISNAAQLLRESSDEQDKESQRLLEIILDHTRRVNEIVENITQLSRRDRTSRERTPLASWAMDFVSQYTQGSEAPFEAIEIVADVDDIEVCVDPSQIYQVVANLCQNAIRHSPPFEGQVLIRFHIGLDSQERPFLDVIDWGKGIPPEIAQNVFDPFFTTTSQGTGLGLYISRELCEGNGAMLQLMPPESIGCRFRVSFARAEECGEL